MNYLRIIAGAFAGSGAILLIYKGYISEGGILLASMMAFFVGEKNGERKKELSA